MSHIFMTYGLALLWDFVVAFCIFTNLLWPDVAKRFGVYIERRYWYLFIALIATAVIFHLGFLPPVIVGHD